MIEAETGAILFEKGADVPTPPSSMAKLMTTEVVFNEIKQGHIRPDQEYIISEDAWRRGGAPSAPPACSLRSTAACASKT